LPSYLDRATDDLPPFEIRYPKKLGGNLVAVGRAFPSSWKTPKETWLLARVAELLARGEKILVFLRHTGSPELPARLLRLLREVTPSVSWLDAKKVPTATREAWIDENVLKRGVQVLLVNPNAVRTGLNNLVSFSAGLWHELDLSAYTMRQATGRLHRIGQIRPVTVETSFYAGTTQQVMFDLLVEKVSVSLQVDALDLQSALQALGASDEETTALSTALSLGQAVYQALTNRRR
jgi:SNF2 family DNA or RNA helicase